MPDMKFLGQDNTTGQVRDVQTGDFLIIPSACAGLGTISGAATPGWSLAHDGDIFLTFTEAPDGNKTSTLLGRQATFDNVSDSGTFRSIGASLTLTSSAGTLDAYDGAAVFGQSNVATPVGVSADVRVQGVVGVGLLDRSGTASNTARSIGLVGLGQFSGAGSGGSSVGVFARLGSGGATNIGLVAGPANLTGALPTGDWAAYFEGAVQHAGNLDLNGNLDVSGAALFNSGNGNNDFQINAQTAGVAFFVDVSTSTATASNLNSTTLATLNNVMAADIDCSGEVDGNQFAINGTVFATSGLALQNLTGITSTGTAALAAVTATTIAGTGQVSTTNSLQTAAFDLFSFKTVSAQPGIANSWQYVNVEPGIANIAYWNMPSLPAGCILSSLTFHITPVDVGGVGGTGTLEVNIYEVSQSGATATKLTGTRATAYNDGNFTFTPSMTAFTLVAGRRYLIRVYNNAAAGTYNLRVYNISGTYSTRIL